MGFDEKMAHTKKNRAIEYHYSVNPFRHLEVK